MFHLYHISLFLVIGCILSFLGLWLAAVCDFQWEFSGLLSLACMRYLRRREALCGAFIIGVWIDAMQPQLPICCVHAFLISATVWLFHPSSYRNILYAHPKKMTFVLTFILQTIALIWMFLWHGVPLFYVKSYWLSMMISACLGALLAPLVLKIRPLGLP